MYQNVSRYPRTSCPLNERPLFPWSEQLEQDLFSRATVTLWARDAGRSLDILHIRSRKYESTQARAGQVRLFHFVINLFLFISQADRVDKDGGPDRTEAPTGRRPRQDVGGMSSEDLFQHRVMGKRGYVSRYLVKFACSSILM